MGTGDGIEEVITYEEKDKKNGTNGKQTILSQQQH
jgi:hypothetical protein